MYAAAMWEFQRLHFDHDWARREGLARAVVQGPLLGNYLAQTVEEWTAGVPELERVAWRHHAVVSVGEPLTCGGTVSAPDVDGRREAVLWIRDSQAATVVSGSAGFRPVPDGGEQETF